MKEQTKELIFMEKILIGILKEQRCWYDMYETCRALCHIRSVYKVNKREFDKQTAPTDNRQVSQ